MRATLPADKSIAHRALLCAALARGPSRVRLMRPRARDVTSTLRCLAALGVALVDDGDEVSLCPPQALAARAPLDAENSGTTARLLAGALAGRGVTATVVGDGSLSRRPMARVAAPVNRLFATPALTTAAEGTLPLEVRPARYLEDSEIVVETVVPSAQVKSAVLLAALARAGRVVVREPAPTRDHSERMLAALGARVTVVDEGAVALEGPAALEGFSFAVPRDPSALALLAVAAVTRGAPLCAGDVCVAPRRLGFASVLRRMGVAVAVVEREQRLGQPVGELEIRAGAHGLAAVTVAAAEVPSLVDELPALAALAAVAAGTSRFEGVGELRLKESDRVRGIVDGLAALGARAWAEGDDLVVEGRPGALSAAAVDARGDHRLEMAFAALAAGLGLDVPAPPVSVADVSFPGFREALAAVCSSR